MSWTSNVTCSRCGGFDWGVIDGQWTCGCLHVMTVAEVAEFHDATARTGQTVGQEITS